MIEISRDGDNYNVIQDGRLVWMTAEGGSAHFVKMALERIAELEAIVAMINDKLDTHPMLSPDVSPHIQLTPDEVEQIRKASPRSAAS